MQMTLGEHLRLTLYGSSHGPHIGAIIKGIPKGIVLDERGLKRAMDMRKPGGPYSSQRKETDEVHWLSGVENGVTNGETIDCRILNSDVRSKDYGFLPDHPRPGHQDMVMMLKTNGVADLRGGGTSSARMTAPIVAVSSLLRPWIATKGVEFRAHVGAIGSIQAKSLNESPTEWTTEESKHMRCYDADAAKAMTELITSYRKKRDSIGSRVDLVIDGLPLGVGEPWFDGLEPALARAMMSIPAARGVEFGHGFEVQTMTGSEHNSPWGGTSEDPVLVGEQPDGALAGLATGSPIHVQIAFKPPSSIPQTQITLNVKTNKQEPLTVKGRHDPVLAPRAVAVVEAMAVLVISDLMIRGGFMDE